MANDALDAQVISDPAELAALAPAWDALAIANGRPLSAPAWLLGAWRHLRSDADELRVVAVRDGAGELVAIAPLVVDHARAARTDLRLLGAPMPRLAPLGVPGREWEAAGPIAAALASARPRADVLAFEAGPLVDAWPLAIAERWPGPLRPLLRRYHVQASHFVSLRSASLDDWFATKNAHFRNRMRRTRRKFAEAGGTARLATAETLEADVDAFLRLHASRWAARGGSSIVAHETQLRRMYLEIAGAHLDEGRLRIFVLELDGEAIAARLVAAAGGEVIALNGGWDERYAKLGIANVGMLHAIEDGIARGETRLDLGPGDQEFKRRLADGNDPVAWTLLALPRARMPLTLARVAPTVFGIPAREALKRALPAERQARLRGLRDRMRR